MIREISTRRRYSDAFDRAHKERSEAFRRVFGKLLGRR